MLQTNIADNFPIIAAVSVIEKFNDTMLKNLVGEWLVDLSRHTSRNMRGHRCNDFSLGMTGSAGVGRTTSTRSTPEMAGKPQ
ncbi:hypothetical protein [Burkholderia multivorans]|uniref:hypothetical protein n=1 Tax=Burkholderia multivorans TaxID=87883 RepID=UPI000D01741C|nr:hypothetical protein [Burkholderia multivorans]PRH46147.1 hypothetical protein C6V05_22780 [Burkholderia multivorans]